MLHKGSQQNWYPDLVMRESMMFCALGWTVSSRNPGYCECLCDCSEHLSFPAANTEHNTCTLGRKIKENNLTCSPILQYFDLAVN